MQVNKNSFRWAIGALLAVSLIAFTVSQQDKIRSQADLLLKFENRITSLESLLHTETTANEELRTENARLQQENLVLRDSIQILGTQMSVLQGKLHRHLATIKGIKAELAKKEIELQQLRLALSEAKSKKELSEKQLQKLQADITAVEQQKQSLVTMQVEESTETTSTEEEMLRTEMELNRKQRLDAVVNNTSVNYKSIQCSKTRSGSNIKKLEEDGSNWIYTTIQFDMENPDPQLMADEYFVMRIVNVDTGEELPYLESNPAYANSAGETKGFAFQWSGNPTQLVYINMQAKAGQNYDLKIYFLSDEKEYLLSKSIQPLLRNGKVVR